MNSRVAEIVEKRGHNDESTFDFSLPWDHVLVWRDESADTIRWKSYTHNCRLHSTSAVLCYCATPALELLIVACFARLLLCGNCRGRRNPPSLLFTAQQWFMAYRNKWSPSLVRNGEWLWGKRRKLTREMTPAVLWACKWRNKMIPLKSIHYWNSGPNISKMGMQSHNTKGQCLFWK